MSFILPFYFLISTLWKTDFPRKMWKKNSTVKFDRFFMYFFEKYRVKAKKNGKTVILQFSYIPAAQTCLFIF